LILAAIVLAERRREALGGVLFGAGVLFKLWPVVVLPILFFRRRLRALWIALAVTGGGVLVWAVAFGTDAVGQVASYRGATGWQIESLFGAVVRLMTGEDIRVEAGASRIGHAPTAALWGLRFATFLLVALAWRLARDRSVDPAGGPSLASVACLLVLSPVASPQYVAWLLPWAAVVAAERASRDVRILTFCAAATASAVFVIYWGNPYRVTLLVLLALARAICIGLLAVIGLTHERVDRSSPERLAPVGAAVA
jgi:hypothetical protein